MFGEVERKNKKKDFLTAFQDKKAKEALEDGQTDGALYQQLGWGAKKRIKP